MKALSIIGIILFTWLLVSRYAQYDSTRRAVGATFTYTEPMIQRAETKQLEEISVCIYAVVYAIIGIISAFKKRSGSSTSTNDLTALFTLKEKGAITEEEYENEKKKLLR